MSAEDIRRALRERPVGTFRILAGFGSGVEGDIYAHLHNKAELTRRLTDAVASGFAIEAVSLRHQFIDFWLRILLLNRSPSEQRQRETGRLLKQCFERAGLEKRLYDDLVRFNADRVDAIHGFVIGRVSYDEISELASASAGLGAELVEFVLTHAGKVVTPESFETFHNVGDMIVDVAAVIDATRQSPW